MQEYFRTHRKTRRAGIVVALLVGAVVLFLTLFDWNVLKGPLVHAISKATGRHASIDGDLKVHLWSWSPRAEVDGLKLDNPPWADRHSMFAAQKIIVSVSLGRLLRGQLVLPLVELDNPDINLERDTRGRASWELGTKTGTPNHDTRPVKLPAIRRLDIVDGRLHVVDEIRKLTFSGSLMAGETAGRDSAAALQIRSSGSLNAKPFRLDASGGPLLNLAPDKPYPITAHLTASDIDLETHVTVNKPFDLGALDIDFTVSGADLADVYYLTGLALPNTPDYRLAGRVHINGNRIAVTGLKGRLGSSDLSGTIGIDTTGDKPKLTARLESQQLDLADLAPTLGQRAPTADRLSASTASASASAAAPRLDAATSLPPAAANPGLLLPDANLQVQRVRGMNADVSYRASAVKVPKIPMKEFTLHLLLDDGLLSVDPLSFDLEQGKFTGRVQIDARPDVPVTDVDMHIDDIDLDEFKSSTMKESPLDGVLLGRFKFHGVGASVHKFASTSNGSMSVVIPHGQINDAIAELTGINVLQGLGLLLGKEQKKAEIRCGIMDFKDHDGHLDTTTVYIDTSNVLITGRGGIDLQDEDIKLSLQGDPKHLRLVRLRSPISVGGTMLHPSVGINAGKLAEQAGIAAALGTLLTPAAAALAFIDPGLAKDKDCSTVLAQADAGVKN